MLADLEVLNLAYNKFEAVGLTALVGGLVVGAPALLELSVRSNRAHAGLKALSAALARGSLPRLKRICADDKPPPELKAICSSTARSVQLG